MLTFGIITEDTEATLPSPLDTKPFMWEHSAVELNSVTYTDLIKSMEFTISNNLYEGLNHGTNKATKLIEGTLELDAVAEIDVVDGTVQALFTGRTEFALEWKLTKTAATEELIISCAKCKIFDHPMPFDMEGEIVTVTPAIRIFRDDITAVCWDATQNWD